jgi:chromosomal replication initiation ATPase DnaA
MIPILRKIQSAVCAEFDVTHRELKSKSRERHITDAKHAMILLLSKKTRMTMSQIAIRLKCDRHTSLNSVYRAQALIDTDPDYKSRFERARGKVEGK